MRDKVFETDRIDAISKRQDQVMPTHCFSEDSLEINRDSWRSHSTTSRRSIGGDRDDRPKGRTEAPISLINSFGYQRIVLHFRSHQMQHKNVSLRFIELYVRMLAKCTWWLYSSQNHGIEYSPGLFIFVKVFPIRFFLFYENPYSLLPLHSIKPLLTDIPTSKVLVWHDDLAW